MALGRFREPRPADAPEVRSWDDGPAPKQEVAEYKFKAPEEVDEEASMAKAKAKAADGKAKHKAEQAAQEKLDSIADDDVPKLAPVRKVADQEDAAEAQRDAAIDAEEKKAGDAADKDEAAASKAKAELDAEIAAGF